jgi:hypothetical protein
MGTKSEIENDANLATRWVRLPAGFPLRVIRDRVAPAARLAMSVIALPAQRVDATQALNLSANYLAFVKLVSIRIWRRSNGSMP